MAILSMRTVRSPDPHGFRSIGWDRAYANRFFRNDCDEFLGRLDRETADHWEGSLQVHGSVLRESNPQDHYFGSLYEGSGSLSPL